MMNLNTISISMASKETLEHLLEMVTLELEIRKAGEAGDGAKLVELCSKKERCDR